MKNEWRKTDQPLLPYEKPSTHEGYYDIYPSFKLDENKIFEGFESLAEVFTKHKTVILDGYVGVFFDQFRDNLDAALKKRGIRTSWKSTSEFLKPPAIIEKLVSPFTGGDDPLFGKRTSLRLEDFYDINLLQEAKPDPDAGLNLIIGAGASLSGWNGILIYIDIPKNEIQFRAKGR